MYHIKTICKIIPRKKMKIETLGPRKKKEDYRIKIKSNHCIKM